MHTGTRAGGRTLVVTRTLAEHGTRVTVTGREVASHGATPVVCPRVELVPLGEREPRGAIMLPSGHVPGSRRLPVLLSPYGGPGGALVLRALDDYKIAQWFADQGFAVLVVDRPGSGPSTLTS